jgi:hypothetical protein
MPFRVSIRASPEKIGMTLPMGIPKINDLWFTFGVKFPGPVLSKNKKSTV